MQSPRITPRITQVVQQSPRLRNHKAALTLISMQGEASADYLTDALVLAACKRSAGYVPEAVHDPAFRPASFISLTLGGEAQPVRYPSPADHVPQMTNTRVIDTPVTHTQTTDHSGGTSDPGRQLSHSGGR